MIQSLLRITVMQKTEQKPVFNSFLKRLRAIRKVLILGSGAVGKSTLLSVLKSGKTLEELNDSSLSYQRTPFLELDTINAKNLLNTNNTGVFQIFDVAGQYDQPAHPIKDIAHMILGGTDLIMLLFSSNNLQTLLDIDIWLKMVRNFYFSNDSYEEPEFILIKNKIDLESNIDQSMIDAILGNDLTIRKYFEISCNSGIGIKQLKEYLLNNYCSK